MTTENQSAAYLQGYAAFSSTRNNRCLYSLDTAQYYEWHEGWGDSESYWMDVLPNKYSRNHQDYLDEIGAGTL